MDHWEVQSRDHGTITTQQWQIMNKEIRTLQVSDVQLRLTSWSDTARAALSWSRAAGIFILQLTLNTTQRHWILPHFAARNSVIEVGRLKAVWMITLRLWWAWLQITVLRQNVLSLVIVSKFGSNKGSDIWRNIAWKIQFCLKTLEITMHSSVVNVIISCAVTSVY